MLVVSRAGLGQHWFGPGNPPPVFTGTARVLDWQGKPVAGVQVFLTSEGGRGVDTHGVAASDSNGIARFQDVVIPGFRPVEFRLRDPRYGRATETALPGDETLIRIMPLFASGQRAEAKMSPMLVGDLSDNTDLFTGSVLVIDQDGKPVNGAIVSLIDAPAVGIKTYKTAQTDANGLVQFVNAIVPAIKNLAYVVDRGGPVKVGATVPAILVSSVQIKVERYAHIEFWPHGIIGIAVVAILAGIAYAIPRKKRGRP